MDYGILGYLGGVFLSAQLVPQIIKVYQRRDASQLSMGFMICNVVGLGCMTSYGVLNNDPPIYVPTSVSLFNTCILISQKCFYDYSRYTTPKTEQIEETQSPEQSPLPVSSGIQSCCHRADISPLSQPLTSPQRP